uniref:Uncharacterized protein n=1 Tax=Arundo donax TaxID=35708 RepID=A0A0A9FYT0_ARUDO
MPFKTLCGTSGSEGSCWDPSTS